MEEAFDIEVTNLSKRTKGMRGFVQRVHPNGVEARLENGEVITLRNSHFDYLAEKSSEKNSQS